jgi:hypothetical protein
MPPVEKPYRVFAALHDETDKGWVWLSLNEAGGFRTRMTVRIACGKRSVYCEYRGLDANFVRRYDANDETTSMYFGTTVQDHAAQKDLAQTAVRHREKVDLQQVSDVIVIGDWYRKALGGFRTGGKQSLAVSVPGCSQWADLRAACQHPEPVMRIATRIAILGAWLGVAGFLPAVAEALKPWLGPFEPYPALGAQVLAALFGIPCYLAGRGVK